ncbi:hypothetical protein [Streptacidiphilus albus]|uniref:hypothetical protein n=1 Tax=Streptacidiphilus albus TaxID=105425 RepID=UPI00054B053F|nr:hypothetical protein [Streptacidiphilus albus]
MARWNRTVSRSGRLAVIALTAVVALDVSIGAGSAEAAPTAASSHLSSGDSVPGDLLSPQADQPGEWNNSSSGYVLIPGMFGHH